MAQEKRTNEIATVALLFAGALVIRLAAIWFWRFDGLYGQDAFDYYRQAVAIAQGLPKGELPPRDFFWPNGYPLLAAAAFRLLGQGEWAAQLAVVLCGAALAPLAYGLNRALTPGIGRRAGIWAALMVAVAGQPVISSIVIMADIPALFWAALAAWLLVQAWPMPEPGAPGGAARLRSAFLLLAGLALGLAVVTRWIYALLALPFAAYGLYQARQSRRSGPALMLPVLAGLAVLLPQVWLSLNRPESLLHSWLVNWRVGNAFGRQFENIDGHYNYSLPVGLYYGQPLFHPNFLFPLLGLAALWGLWFLGRRRAWGTLILLGGWLGVVYCFLAGIPYENFRFGLTLYLPAALLAGIGVEALRSQAPRFVARQWEHAITLLAVLSLLGMGVWAVRSSARFLTAQNQSKAIVSQVVGLLPEKATVLAFGPTLALQHYSDLDVLEFSTLNDKTLDAATVTATPRYLLLDLDNLAQQWQGLPPALNYQWLRTHRTLTPVGEFPPYSLFLIGK